MSDDVGARGRPDGSMEEAAEACRQRRPVMTMREAAEMLGVSLETVRRYVDAMDRAGRPVAERERRADGTPRPRAWRRPYRDAMQAWRDSRQGRPGRAGSGTGMPDATGDHNTP